MVGRPRGSGVIVRDILPPAADAPAGAPAQLRVRAGAGFIFATVDEKWLAYLQQFSWQLEGKAGYVKRGDARRGDDDKYRTRTVRLHVEVARPAPGFVVDHINGDKLDNREVNLRVTTQQVNQRNRTVSRNNPTGFKGVLFRKSDQRYYAAIQVNGRRIARFAATAEAAARKHDELARLHFGDAARLNFPRPGERGLNGVLMPTESEDV